MCSFKKNNTAREQEEHSLSSYLKVGWKETGEKPLAVGSMLTVCWKGSKVFSFQLCTPEHSGWPSMQVEFNGICVINGNHEEEAVVTSYKYQNGQVIKSLLINILLAKILLLSVVGCIRISPLNQWGLGESYPL